MATEVPVKELTYVKFTVPLSIMSKPSATSAINHAPLKLVTLGAPRLKLAGVKLLATVGDWSKISYDYQGSKYTGYVKSKYLEDDTAYTKNILAEMTKYDPYDPGNVALGDPTRVYGNTNENIGVDSSGAATVTYSEDEDKYALQYVTSVNAPAVVTKFTNPANSIGANYPEFSPDPDPNAEEEFVSQREDYDAPFSVFVIPGYTPARMTIYTYVDKRQVARSFEFLISPVSMSESNSSNVIPVRTGAGFFLARSGNELGRLNIGGYLLETQDVDERRTFLEDYYRAYLIDKVNTFNSYFNESSLFLELEGYRYRCVLLNLDLAKSSESMFLFRYSMNLLVLGQETMGVIGAKSGRYARQTAATQKVESVNGASIIFSKVDALYSAVNEVLSNK